MQDEDEIVASIPVHLNKKLEGGIFIVQQPLRPTDRPYEADMADVSLVRVRPKHKRLEVVYDLKQDLNYDLNANNNLKQLILQSRSVSLHTNTLVGVFHKDHLHVTPVSTLLRMRPSFDHLNRTEVRVRDTDAEEAKAPKRELKAVVRPVKTLVEQNAPVRPKTWAQLQQEESKEPLTVGDLLDAKVCNLWTAFRRIHSLIFI